MPVLLRIDAAPAVTLADPMAAVVHLLRHHCTPEQIQALRLNLGRDILNTFGVVEHVNDNARGTVSDRPADSPATTARKAREDAAKRSSEANGVLPPG